MGKENLRSLADRTTEEQREIARLGGIASGKARAKKREMREWAEIIGALPTKVACPDGSELKGATLDADAVMQQYRQAHKGNTKAAAFIATLKGQLAQKVDLTSTQPVILVDNDADRAMIEKLKNRE